MALISPCLECDLHHQGISKSCQECAECEKRIDYVRKSAASHGHGIQAPKFRDNIILHECKKCGLRKKLSDAEKYFNRHASTNVLLKTCKKCEVKKLNEKEASEKKITCSDCGNSWPESEAEEHFIRHTNGNLLKMCRTCFGNKAHNKSNNRFIIKIDFSEYQEHFEKLLQIANQELRTVEKQALYFLINKFEK